MRVLQEDNMAADDEESGPFQWGEVWKTFKNPSLWLLAVVGFFNGKLQLIEMKVGSHHAACSQVPRSSGLHSKSCTLPANFTAIDRCP